MTEQLEVLKDIASRLQLAGVSYMVSGSVAMNYYAQPRMTRDIDLVVELTPESLSVLERLLGEEYYFDHESAVRALETRRMFNAIHLGRMVKVDLIVRKESDYRKTEFARRRRVEVLGVAFDIAAPEDLVLSKLDWARESGSELQLRDARNLLGAVSDLDHQYLAVWAKRLGLEEALERVMP